jgi:hypothetical protein
MSTCSQKSGNLRCPAQVFCDFAILIASLGLYAVISQAVERRMHELGVRVAFGASGLDIARCVLGHGLRVTAEGVALGIHIGSPTLCAASFLHARRSGHAVRLGGNSARFCSVH